MTQGSASRSGDPTALRRPSIKRINWCFGRLMASKAGGSCRRRGGGLPASFPTRSSPASRRFTEVMPRSSKVVIALVFKAWRKRYGVESASGLGRTVRAQCVLKTA
jgi:hypothetical protein